MIKLNNENLRVYMKKLEDYNDYVPLILLQLMGRGYMKRITPELKDKILYNREQLQYAENYNKFMEDDVERWLKDNPEFEGLFIIE